MNSITKSEGFKFIRKLTMVGKNVGFTKHRKSKETIFIFSKGNTNNKKLNTFLKKINKCNIKTKRK